MHLNSYWWRLTSGVLRTALAEPTLKQHERRTIENVALDFTKAFYNAAKGMTDEFNKKYCPRQPMTVVEVTGFDPIKFLDQCSPDTDRWPLSELWDEVDMGNYTEVI